MVQHGPRYKRNRCRELPTSYPPCRFLASWHKANSAGDAITHPPEQQRRIDQLSPISAGARRAISCVLSRSEEHTSELQSLMRISYAVFCLKKKKNITKNAARMQKINVTY